MSIFPQIDNEILNVLDENKVIGFKEPLFDFQTKRIVLKDGKVVYCTEKQAIKQWVTLLINTQIDKYNIYKNTEFGLTDLYNLIGHEFQNFLVSELKRELKEKIKEKQGVKDVININVSNEFNSLKIELTILTEYDEIIEDEVIIK